MSQFLRGLYPTRKAGVAGQTRITDENITRGTRMQGAMKPAAARADVGPKRRILGDVSNLPAGQRRTAYQKPAAGYGGSKRFQVYRDTAPKPQAVRPRATAAVSAVPTRTRAAAIPVPQKPKDRSLELKMKELSIAEVDKADIDDPQAVVEYIADIFDHVKNNEGSYVPADYMPQQKLLNAKQRGILVDWLVQVHLRFRLRTDTLFLAVNYLDRYLSEKYISKKELQLVGITAMLVAAKYEETYVPVIQDFRYMCDNTYTRRQILAAEREFLATLKFNLTVPTPYLFARRFAKVAPADPVTNMIIKFVLELILVDYDMILYKPSMQAAAATYVGRREGGLELWPTELQEATGFSQTEVEKAVIVLDEVILRSRKSKLTGVRKKYSHTAFHKASMRL